MSMSSHMQSKNGPSMRTIVSNPQIALFSTTAQLGKIKIHGQEKENSNQQNDLPIIWK